MIRSNFGDVKIDDNILNSLDILKNISRAQQISGKDAEVVAGILKQYFGEFERSQHFRGVERLISPRFLELLQHFDHENGVLFSNRYFLFCYTLTQDYKEVQHSIYNEIALPYKHWVENNWDFFASPVQNIIPGDEFIFVCRQATTKGGYAPGSSIYTHAKALIESNRNVTIISFGHVSEEFHDLSRKHQNLKVLGLEKSSPTGQLLTIIEVCKLLKPKVVLTEIEFDVISVLSILKPNIPVVYLSPGYYNLPWYDKIGLTDSLSLNPIGNRKKDFFEIPTYVASEILNPKVSVAQVRQTKKTLGIEPDNFIIGSLARMEKFQEPFLQVLYKVLERCNHVKVLLAGANDRSKVEATLGKFIHARRALVLPRSDAHVLGHCFNLGVDTFPTHSGFSVLELMAKGIPVVAKRDREMDANWRQRVPESMRSDDNSLSDLIIELATNPLTYQKLCEKTKMFMLSGDYDKKFVCSLDKALKKGNC